MNEWCGKVLDFLTRRHEDCCDGEYTPDDHTETENPPTPPSIHDDPTEQIRRHLHDAGQEEGHVFVVTQSWTVVTQSDVDGFVGDPAHKLCKIWQNYK